MTRSNQKHVHHSTHSPHLSDNKLKISSTDVFSELNQYRSSVRTVSDQYAAISIKLASIRAALLELIQTCRSDKDAVYSSTSKG